MAFRRFNRRRPRTRFRPRRRFSRRRRTTRKGSANSVYYFTRFVQRGTFTADAAFDYFNGISFRLADVPGSAEFTSLYDMYKIKAVKVMILPSQTENNSLTTVNNAFASSRFFSAIDYNDATVPTAVDDIRQYKTCKSTPVLKPHYRYIRAPKILDTSSYSVTPWVSTASAATLWYGLKIAVQPIFATVTTQLTYTMECKYYMADRKSVV